MSIKNYAILLFVLVFLPGCGNKVGIDNSILNQKYNSKPAEVVETATKTPENKVEEKLTINNKETKPMETEKKQVSYTAVLHTTAGDITIKLSDDQTPKTVQNFVDLAKKDFYNGVIFHRVIDGFMIQGGDPTGTGAGGPGYKFEDEPFTGEYERGTVAMANSGPDTNGSQFFIMHASVPLPKNYTIFGKVTSGLETVDKIATAPVEMGASGELSKPVNPIKINSVSIIEN